MLPNSAYLLRALILVAILISHCPYKESSPNVKVLEV